MTTVSLVLKVKRLGKERNYSFIFLEPTAFLLLLLTLCIENRPGLECYILVEFGQRS